MYGERIITINGPGRSCGIKYSGSFNYTYTSSDYWVLLDNNIKISLISEDDIKEMDKDNSSTYEEFIHQKKEMNEKQRKYDLYTKSLYSLCRVLLTKIDINNEPVIPLKIIKNPESFIQINGEKYQNLIKCGKIVVNN